MKDKVIDYFGFLRNEQAALMLENHLKKIPPHKRELKQKYINETIEQGERFSVDVISSETVDFDKELVIQKGIDLSVFRKNPVVLLYHDAKLPCADCAWVIYDQKNNRTLAKTIYQPRPDNEEKWLPDHAYNLVKQKLVKGKSITFLPLEQKEAKDMPHYKSRHPTAELVCIKCLLLEYSLVACPNNYDSVTLAVKDIHIDMKELSKKIVSHF